MSLGNYRNAIAGFTEENLPNLDVITCAALEFFSEQTLPQIDTTQFKRPLVVGSGNALPTGMLMFRSVDAVYADEGSIRDVLARTPSIDAVYVISASGSKHAVGITQALLEVGLPVFLVTSQNNAPAAKELIQEHVMVTPHIREPYTYNTSTYLGMLLASAPEQTRNVLEHIEREVFPRIDETLAEFSTFTLIVRPEFEAHRAMFQTKFDELFGPMLHGRVFTESELLHAKTVVSSDSEYFIEFGTTSKLPLPPERHRTIPLPSPVGPAAMLAIGYVVIGRLQELFPPYFKDHIRTYVADASTAFNQNIPIIVE